MGWKLFRVLRWTTDSTKPSLNKIGALLMPSDTKRLWLSLASGWFGVDTPPVGATYMQFPGKSDPGTLWPNSTWSNISSETLLKGRAPRIEGSATNGSAASFGSSQEDQFQEHGHALYNSGALYAVGGGDSRNHWTPSASSYTSGFPALCVKEPLASGSGGSPRYGTETRVASVTVRIWQRTA